MLNNPNVWAAITFLLGTALQLGGYQSTYAAWGCFTVAGVLGLYGLLELSMLPGTPWGKRRAFWTLRFGGKVPLDTAAALAYEEARANYTFWALAAERLATEKSPGGILDYVATYFGMKVPLWGTRPPSERIERIDSKAASHGHFSDGARKLIVDDKSSTVFTNLSVAAKDVRTVVELMREKVFENGKG